MTRLWFKLFYAVEFVGVGIFMPYLAMFFLRKGLTSVEVGLLLAVMPLSGFLVQPIWGVVSDKLSATKLLVTLGCWFSGILVVMLTMTDRFDYLFVIVAVTAVVRAPIHPNVAALALNHLELQGKQDEYGKFRLWGSLGFIVATLFAGGLLFDGRLTVAIYLYSGCMLVLGFISLLLPDRHVFSKSRWRDGARLIVTVPQLRLFLVGVTCVGVTLGVANQYLVVYMNELSAPGWVIGWTVALSALPEIPLMNLAVNYIRRWGLRAVFVVGISALPVRWLCNMLVTEPLFALPVQVLHGVAMSALLVIGVIYIDNILPRNWRASGQALYVSCLHGLGPSIGLFAAGWVVGLRGTTPVWGLCFIMGIMGCVIVSRAMSIKTSSIAVV